MHLKILLPYLLLLYSTIGIAQEFKLGAVTADELHEKAHPQYPDAAAAILYKKGTTTFEVRSAMGWITITEVVVRLKIYNKLGYDSATIQIPYYDWNSIQEEVVISDAYTYNILGGNIEKTKLEEEGIFIEEITERSKVKKLVMPNIKEGSVIEYKYIIKSPRIGLLPAWYFQYDIPAKTIAYDVWLPQFLVYNRILNQSGANIAEERDTRKKEISFGIYTTVYSETAKFYKAENVPPYKEESYVDNILNYLPFVKHELSGYKSLRGLKREYATNWSSIAMLLENDVTFGGQLRHTEYFKKDIDSLFATDNVGDNKLTAIYNYVKNRMTWNESYGYDCIMGTEYAYENKTGNVGEINLMLVAMLRYAGYNAYPVLLSTRSNGIATFQSLQSYNYVVVGLESIGRLTLLDATSKESPPGLLPIRALNGYGRMIKNEYETKQVSLVPTVTSTDNITVVANLSADGNITGQARKQYAKYNAYRFRRTHLAENEDTRIAEIETNLNNIELFDYKLTGKEEYANPVVERFSFESTMATDVIGNKIYLSPMLFYTVTENPFTEENRVYPIDFGYPRSDRFSISITIPDGYILETLPESARLVLEDGICTFNFNVAQKGRQIQIVVLYGINTASIQPKHYQKLKVFFSDMIKKQNEKIVLKKI
ncbi:transglutaminase-like domain-containing protein [Flavobacterium litorale]|uniref:Transglutaminase-like domain-containing protein n=1 Tax=Flavobacterium litorale TaxID=2856519 RepID=A0ABX8V3T9_9FLAO|nr:transglutaminase-like domain-containing protein [Flavobacterium litorale]QYJ67157.1 transglutaminase-like domain-containing protein [Flavobacterium litorale]